MMSVALKPWGWGTLAGTLLLCLGTIAPTRAASLQTSVIFPGDILATQEGGTANAYPFNISDPTLSPGEQLTSQRYQQVYDATPFLAFPGQVYITEIRFRPDAQFGSSFTTVLPDIQINLSTTPKAPDGLSPVFAENVGADDRSVIPRGALSLTSNFTGATAGPKDFDVVLKLSDRFLYDPRRGNLLLDVRNFGGGVTTFLDAVFDPSDSTSRLFTLAGGVNSITADFRVTSGLVTQFTIEPFSPQPPSERVPEPGAVAGLLAVIALGTGLKRRFT